MILIKHIGGCRGSISGFGTLITPKKERIISTWDKKHKDDPPLLLSGCIK